MKSIYFFTTSLNFGNIFSSESISPEIFYSNRGFGFDYYDNPFKDIIDHILLFEKYPIINISKSEDIDVYKIIIEFDGSNTKIDGYERNGIWICPSSIQINLKNIIRIYFSSRDEMNRVVAKAESSKALKTLVKYQPFFSIEKPLQQAIYDLSKIQLSPNLNLHVYIERDRIFNSFKGFIYGLIAGKSNRKNPNEIAFVSSLQEIKNGFALLKNSSAHNSYINYVSSKNKDKYFRKNTDYNMLNEIQFRLNKSIDESERLFISFIDTIEKVNFVNEYMKNVVFEGYEKEASSEHIEGAFQLIKFIRGLEKNIERDARIWFWENNRDNPYILYEVIRYSIKCYCDASDRGKKDDLDSDILKAIFRLEKYSEKILLNKAKGDFYVDFNLIEFKNNRVKIPNNIDEDGNFEPLLNLILNNSKKGKGKVNDEQLIPLVERAGELFQPGLGKKTNLFRYLTKQDVNYNEPDNASFIMRNFTAFIFNPNEIEKLQKYIEDKGVQEPQYAFAFFGAFNGFASLSKEFTKSLISNQNIQFKLDDYFEIILNEINLTKNIVTDDMHFINTNTKSLEQEHDKSSPSSTISSNSTVTLNNRNEISKINLQQLKDEILSQIKNRALLKPIFENEFNEKLNEALKEIDNYLDALPYKTQQEFIKNRLFTLFSSKYKIKGIGEQSLKKIFNVD